MKILLTIAGAFVALAFLPTAILFVMAYALMLLN